jgi:ABC-type antimicrobial peptide transport system permease subunit
MTVLSNRVERVGGVAALPVQRPTDLVNFGRVQSLPIVLASILSALAALTMAHLLVTSIRRHRTELAVLRAIGCAPRQVRRTVSVQATTLAVLALALAVPLGLLAGRWVWHVFAHGLGVSAGASAPMLALAILVPATIVVANLMSYLPARAAARASIASILRAE